MEKSGLTAHRQLTILRIHQNHRHETFCFLSACTDILSVIYIRSASMNADNSLIWPVWQQQPIFDEVKNGGNANVRFPIRITGSYFRNRRNEVNTYVIITDINKNKNRI